MSFPKIIKLVPIITRLLFLATTTVKPSYFDQHVLGHVLNVDDNHDIATKDLRQARDW